MKKLSKKVWVPLVAVCAAIVAFVIIFPILYCCVLNVKLKATATQIDESQKLLVSWDTDKAIDSVTVRVTHGDDLISETTCHDLETILNSQMEVEAMYGKLSVVVKIKKGIYTTSEKFKCNLSASKYNFAPLAGTMTVTLFSLSLDEITENGKIPTFVWFKRSGAWDWANLPENVFPMPTATTKEFLSSGQKKIYKETTAYIKELYSINKNSFFNLYYNDYYAYGWVDAVFSNGLSKDNYKVHLLSDGTASFNYFNAHFNNANANENYSKMAEEWLTLKGQVAKKGYYKEGATGFAIKAENLKDYAFVMAKEEENVEWWLTRINGTLAPNNTDFYNLVASTTSVKVKDLNTSLNAMNEIQKQNLKKLYKFSDAMFEKAEQENKKAMVILGTWTVNEYYFKDYVSAIQTYYGDEYVYYYKGHPKNPTYTESGKLEMLESVGLIDVDSTIPAELIIFFNPEIYLSGYPTTSYVSVPTPDKCCALFNVTKAGANGAYKDNMDFFISKVESTNPVYGSLVTSDRCFLIEYNVTEEQDIAIFDAVTKTIKNYKYNDSTSSYDLVA